MRNQIQIVHENKMSSYLISIIFLDRIKMMSQENVFELKMELTVRVGWLYVLYAVKEGEETGM